MNDFYICAAQNWAAEFGREERSVSLDGDRPSQLLPDDDDKVGQPTGSSSFGADNLQNWKSFLLNHRSLRRSSD